MKKVQDRLFDGQNPVVWSEIKQRAAQKTEWQFHHAGLLDDICNHAERTGKWRQEGSMVRHGPFAKEPTSVKVLLKSRDDETGEAILQITAVGGSRVNYEIGEGPPTASSAVVTNFQDFRTTELVLSFLCVDEGPDPSPTGPAAVWRNEITVKGQFYPQGSDRFFKAVAVPDAPMHYTTDGSDPVAGGIPYSGDFRVNPGTHVIQVVAAKNGVRSAPAIFHVTAAKQGIDPVKDAVWKCRKRFSNLQPSDGFQVLERARTYGATLCDLTINVVSPDTDETLYYTLPATHSCTPDEVITLAEALVKLIPRGQTTITVGTMTFRTGQQLLDWAQQDKLSIDAPAEVKQ